jgi:hypothetical protein
MTRRVTILASCLIAAFAVSDAIATLSSGAMVLPGFSGTDTSFTGSSGTAKLTIKGGASVTCTSTSQSLTFNNGNRHLGPAKLEFKGCTQGGENCRSLGLVAGNTITYTGEWHLVLFVRGGVDAHYYLFLTPSFGIHYECPNAAVRLLTRIGDIEGVIVQPLGSTTLFSVKESSTSTAQEFSEFENEAGTALKAKLETSQEGGADKETFENIENDVLSFELATSIEN